jgi:hypothetical protein
MSEQKLEKKLIAAYDKMIERVILALDDAEQQVLPPLSKVVDNAKQRAIDLKELTRDEADKLSNYVNRDLSSLTEHLSETGQDFKTWFDFDLQLVQDRVLDAFAKVADRTSIQLANLASQAKHSLEYHTGEIVGIGTLTCQSCEHLLNFKKTSRIPPCPHCHKTVFTRAKQR